MEIVRILLWYGSAFSGYEDITSLAQNINVESKWEDRKSEAV